MKRKALMIFILVALFSLVVATKVFAAEVVELNTEGEVFNLNDYGTEINNIVVNAKNVTIEGDAIVSSTTSSTIFVKTGASVVIKGGTYKSASTSVPTYTNAALYVDEGASAVVDGGSFEGITTDYAIRAHKSTITVNAGTFHAACGTSVACCGATITVNGGTWSSDSTVTVDGVTQPDILAACAMESGIAAEVVVTGGTFEDGYDPTKIYTSTGLNSTLVESTANAVAEGYTFDATTGTVSCLHEDCEEHKEVAATYETTGTKAYWSCNTCGKWFEDENATKEITDKDSIVIAKLEKVEEDKKEEIPVVEEKDETPKMGSINMSFVWMTLAVVALVGIATTKKVSKHSK